MSLSVTSAAYWAGVSPNEIIRIIITLLTESEVPESSDKPEHSPNEGLTTDTTGTGERMSEPEYRLRSKPEALSDDDVRDMIKKNNFFIKKRNWTETRQWDNESGDFKHDFKDNGNGTITDSVTGLVWEKAGSPNHMLFRDTQGYIQGLNKKKFAGYNDWRLPTLEELASLLENKEVDDLFTDPLFDRKQRWCWSADKRASRGRGVWHVCFYFGSVNWSSLKNYHYVRAVRSRTIDY